MGCGSDVANLQLALARLSTLLEDVEDEGGAVTKASGTVSQGFCEVLQLPRRELPIKHNCACTTPAPHTGVMQN